MFPTLDSFGDVVLVQKFGISENTLKEGDVIMSKSPVDKSYSVCKRIIYKVNLSHK